MLVGLLLFNLSCSKKKNITSIKIAHSDFAYDIAVVNVISSILESQTKLKIEMIEMPENEILSALNSGKADLSFSTWLPNTHAELLKPYKDSLEFIGDYYDEIMTGIAVPQYMSIASIDQFNIIETAVPREIVCFDTASVMSKSVKDMIQLYALNTYTIKMFNQENEYLTYISNKIANTQPVIFAIYQPHWFFFTQKIKYVNDPKKVFGANEKAVIYARKEFAKDLPKISAFLKQIKLTSNDINELMAQNEAEKSNPKLNAASWIEKNIDRINLWINKASETK